MTDTIKTTFETAAPSAAAEAVVEEPVYPHLKDKSEKLHDAILTLRESETGRQLLDDAAAYGTTIALASLSSSHGSYSSDDRSVLINAASSPDRMVVTLAHELRHSQQYQRGVKMNSFLDTPKSYIQSQGVIEADANIAAAQATWELKEAGIPGPFEAFKSENGPLITTFAKEAENGGLEDGRAHSTAFYAWFSDLEILEAYEKNYLKNYKHRKDRASREECKSALQREVPVMHNIDKVCRLKGKSYLGPEAEEFFNRPERTCVTHETYWAIYRNVRDAKNLGFMSDAKDVMKKEGNFTERPGSDFYYDVQVQRKGEEIGKRQAKAAKTIAGLRLKQESKAKTPDLMPAVLAKKRGSLSK